MKTGCGGEIRRSHDPFYSKNPPRSPVEKDRQRLPLSTADVRKRSRRRGYEPVQEAQRPRYRSGKEPRTRGKRNGTRHSGGCGRRHEEVRSGVQHPRLGRRPENCPAGADVGLLRVLHSDDLVQQGAAGAAAVPVPRLHHYHRLSGVSRQKGRGAGQPCAMVRLDSDGAGRGQLLLLCHQRLFHHSAGHQAPAHSHHHRHHRDSGADRAVPPLRGPAHSVRAGRSADLHLL